MDKPEISESSATQTGAAPLDVGAALRAAREGMGWSIADVSHHIKFAPRQVEALEANDFTHLPEAAFLRGFVRSYARMLQLDEAPLIAALPGATSVPLDGGGSSSAVNVPFPTAQSQRRVNVLWLGAALGVTLILALFVLLHDEQPVAQTDKVVLETVALPQTEVPASAVAAEAESAEPLLAPVTVAASAKPEQKTEASPAPKPASSAKPAAVETQTEVTSVPAEIKTAVPLEQLKRRPMHFVFSEECWAEVIDVNGTVLLSRTNPAGSEQWIGGPRRAPYAVSIARPAGVKLYYRGKEIDLTAYAPNQVARLTVE